MLTPDEVRAVPLFGRRSGPTGPRLRAARSEAASTHGQDVFLIGAGTRPAKPHCILPITHAK